MCASDIACIFKEICPRPSCPKVFGVEIGQLGETTTPLTLPFASGTVPEWYMRVVIGSEAFA